jgi:holin-like protein
MTHLGLLGQYGVRMLVVIVLSTWIGLAVTVLVLRTFRKPGDA